MEPVTPIKEKQLIERAILHFSRNAKIYSLIIGDWENYKLWLVTHKAMRVPLHIEPSRLITKHSYDFSWGYAGSGPSQTALAILLELTTKEFAQEYYQQFKFDLIATLPQENFSLPLDKIWEWIQEIK